LNFPVTAAAQWCAPFQISDSWTIKAHIGSAQTCDHPILSHWPAVHVALVAVVKHDDGGEEIVGGGRYVMLQPGRAKAAFTVVDHHQGRGLGTVLLRH
jgi:hypothetical protein